MTAHIRWNAHVPRSKTEEDLITCPSANFFFSKLFLLLMFLFVIVGSEEIFAAMVNLYLNQRWSIVCLTEMVGLGEWRLHLKVRHTIDPAVAVLRGLFAPAIFSWLCNVALKKKPKKNCQNLSGKLMLTDKLLSRSILSSHKCSVCSVYTTCKGFKGGYLTSRNRECKLTLFFFLWYLV